jgi:Protein of unknown function (DUF1428)
MIDVDVFPSDTSWLSEPTTGVHQFGGGSGITYKSRAQRDRVNAKVMADKRLADMMNPKSLPFDAKRMIYGGFESLVSA